MSLKAEPDNAILQENLFLYISFDERMINVFIKTVLPWFFDISKVHLSPTFTTNYFLVNQKQNW